MNNRLLNTILSGALLGVSLAVTGCAKETYHSESDKPGMMGGHKHEETTVTKNNDGTTTVEKEKSSTK
jgi:hypothetical protein